MTVNSLENTLKKSYEWLNELAEIGHYQDAGQAYSVLRVVLHALRDRLPLEVSIHFASQLPMLLGGVYINGWNPSSLVRDHNLDDFIAEIGDAERSLDVNPEESLKITLRFLKTKMDPGIIEKVIGVLPGEIKKLWNE